MPFMRPGTRFRAAFVHLVISALVAALAGVLVLGVWYPWPYAEISGGWAMFWLLVSVDMVIGPMLTLLIYNPTKSRVALILDFSVIGLLQVAALAYGLMSLFEARPVYLVFEYDRFRVVHAADLNDESIAKGAPEFQFLPVTGPRLLSLRRMKDSERLEMTLAELSGLHAAMQPTLWQAYVQDAEGVRRRMQPVADLLTRFPASTATIRKALKGVEVQQAAYVPMIGKEQYWTVLLHQESLDVLGFVLLDSFE